MRSGSFAGQEAREHFEHCILQAQHEEAEVASVVRDLFFQSLVTSRSPAAVGRCINFDYLTRRFLIVKSPSARARQNVSAQAHGSSPPSSKRCLGLGGRVSSSLTTRVSLLWKFGVTPNLHQILGLMRH